MTGNFNSNPSVGADDGPTGASEEPTQTTRPMTGPPVEVPVPLREDVERDLRKLVVPERQGAPGRGDTPRG